MNRRRIDWEEALCYCYFVLRVIGCVIVPGMISGAIVVLVALLLRLLTVE